jgi:hypothetical protein
LTDGDGSPLMLNFSFRELNSLVQTGLFHLLLKLPKENLQSFVLRGFSRGVSDPG